MQRVWSETQEFPYPKQPIVSQQPTQPLVDLGLNLPSLWLTPLFFRRVILMWLNRCHLWSIPLSLRRVTFTKQLNRFHCRSIPLFLWRVKCLLVTFSSLSVQNLLKKGALNSLRMNPHQALKLLVGQYMIAHCIVDERASFSILSSRAWRCMGSPSLVLTASQLLAFDRITCILGNSCSNTCYFGWEDRLSWLHGDIRPLGLQYARWTWLCLCHARCGVNIFLCDVL